MSTQNYIALRLTDPSTVHAMFTGEKYFTVDRVTDLAEDLIPGKIVFIALGVDKGKAEVDWETGFYAIAHVAKPPFDIGYEKNKRNSDYFKFDIIIDFTIDAPIPRNGFLRYPDSYDAPYIGLELHRDRSQANSTLEESKAVAIVRATIDLFPHLISCFEKTFPVDFMEKVFGNANVLFPVSISYGQDTKSVLANMLLSYEGSQKLLKKAENILIYGVPGAGKSHYIATNYPADDEHKQRVVFHPDYTYSDFVGQILPETKEENGEHIISYSFHPGPFTKILAKAAAHEDEHFYLVIEEINRGNAPAIFGDIFQLLDRDASGESQYGIKNADIAKEVYNGDAEHPVRIPANLTILATMNTADQNVFTLDTAFKRRWKMKSIKNDFEACSLSPLTIGTTGITWKTFATEINKIIVQESQSNVSSEDKRLGAYFVTTEDLADNRTFAEKVLAYLWDDVVKYDDKSKMFDSQLITLEEVIDEFAENGTAVFSSTLRQTLSTVAADE